MDKPYLQALESHSMAPITEAELHAYADRQLSSDRRVQVEQYLSDHPDERQRIQDWREQSAQLRALLAPVCEEPVPLRLSMRPTGRQFPWRACVAGFMIAIVSAASAWTIRGAMDAQVPRLAMAPSAASQRGALTGFAQRAAIAHVVYSPDVRRPVEVGADQELALVTWLTKRMGTEVRPPVLSPLGYELMGGRLLPGGQGPVAQFMYGASGGERLTLYVTREVPESADTQFRFGEDGSVNVFYWVENHLGYAISAGADKAELMRVAQEVYRQLQAQ